MVKDHSERKAIYTKDELQRNGRKIEDLLLSNDIKLSYSIDEWMITSYEDWLDSNISESKLEEEIRELK